MSSGGPSGVPPTATWTRSRPPGGSISTKRCSTPGSGGGSRTRPRLARVTSDELRELFLSFFEARDHRRQRSGSLVPAEYDPSVLLTTAGMQPLKPYFLGQQKPPHHRLTTCQKVFRTVDIEQVGLTTRHLTFFE